MIDDILELKDGVSYTYIETEEYIELCNKRSNYDLLKYKCDYLEHDNTQTRAFITWIIKNKFEQPKENRRSILDKFWEEFLND